METKEILKLCKYYKGENECPFKKGEDKYYFWNGEKMFIETKQDIYAWEQMARIIRQEEDEEKKQTTKDLNDKQFGIVLYIEELTRKWKPYKDMDFIFNY